MNIIRIIPKLIAEDNAQLGSGGPSNAKKGTVDVHRGGQYQHSCRHAVSYDISGM